MSLRFAFHRRYLVENYFWWPRFDYGTAPWKDRTVFEFNAAWLGSMVCFQWWIA